MRVYMIRREDIESQGERLRSSGKGEIEAVYIDCVKGNIVVSASQKECRFIVKRAIVVFAHSP